jgi:hypothetical protein
VTEVYSTANSILTQGFQQTFKTVGPIDAIISLQSAGKLLPNPANDRVIFKVDNPEGLQYRLFDLNGRVLQNGKLETTSTSIDLTGLSPSVYFIKIIKGNKEVNTYKLVKQ